MGPLRFRQCLHVELLDGEEFTEPSEGTSRAPPYRHARQLSAHGMDRGSPKKSGLGCVASHVIRCDDGLRLNAKTTQTGAGGAEQGRSALG